ncbi:hypothetical protein GW820_07125 [archaeon]|nr:hypothetical protein [archaeon]
MSDRDIHNKNSSTVIISANSSLNIIVDKKRLKTNEDEPEEGDDSVQKLICFIIVTVYLIMVNNN